MGTTTYSYFEKCVKVFEGAPIIYLGTKPEPTTEGFHKDYLRYDGRIKEYIESEGSKRIYFVDNWEMTAVSLYGRDGLHLSGKGYAEWDAKLRQLVETQILPSLQK